MSSCMRTKAYWSVEQKPAKWNIAISNQGKKTLRVTQDVISSYNTIQ